MAQRVVVHIGLMKSGTTFLQGRLNANRELLAEQGVLFPGPAWRRHVNAVADLMEAKDRQPGAWASLVEEVDDHPGTAVISMEYLAMLGPRKIKELSQAFDTPDLRIVVGVRDLGRSVPAMWQEVVKNRQTWSWAEYVQSIRSGGEAGKRFWRQQHSGTIVTRWAELVTPEKGYVVTLPPPGAPGEALWDRFSEVAGIEPATWSEAPRANESLGAASTLVIRELNLRTQDLGLKEYKRRVKAVGKHLMPAHRAEEDPIGFVVPGWLVQQSDEIRTQIERSGVHVVGHLHELTPRDVPGVDPDQVTAEAQRDAAVAALDATLRQVARIRPARS
jgi:hypothetical protein